MEKHLSMQLDDIMNESGVTGVICCDLNGLMLAVRGVASDSHAGAVSTIASDSTMASKSSWSCGQGFID